MVHPAADGVDGQRQPSEPWFRKRRESEISQQRRSLSQRRPSAVSVAPQTEHHKRRPLRFWKFILRPWDDDLEADWWFAGTAIPLIAATLAPLANVLSIAALVTSWRMCLVDGVDPTICPWDGDISTIVPELSGHDRPDPRWYDPLIPSHVTHHADEVVGATGSISSHSSWVSLATFSFFSTSLVACDILSHCP